MRLALLPTSLEMRLVIFFCKRDRDETSDFSAEIEMGLAILLPKLQMDYSMNTKVKDDTRQTQSGLGANLWILTHLKQNNSFDNYIF